MPAGVVALFTVGGFLGVSTDAFGADVLDPPALLAAGAVGREEAGTTGGASGLAVAMSADSGGGG